LVERLTIGLMGVTARQEEVVAAVTWCRAGALSWYSPQSSASTSIRGVVVLRYGGAPEFHGLLVGDGVHGVVSAYSASSRAAQCSYTAAPSTARGRAVVHSHSFLDVDVVVLRSTFPFPFSSSSSAFPLSASLI
jgi:hypothetical protein